MQMQHPDHIGPAVRLRPALVSRRQAGLTLVELIVAFSIMMILTTMSVPLVRSQLRRNRERELRHALEEMRKAIDKFKDAADKNQISPTAMSPESMGYPLKLDDLVNGVKGVGPAADVKIKFLRRIPKDPMTNSYDWGKRAMRTIPRGAAEAHRMSLMYLPGARRKESMGYPIRSGNRRQFGFTLVELMIVMAIVVILIGIAVPYYQKSILRAKESVLRNNLFTLRQVIDEYSYDHQKAPQTLQEVVSDGYLRSVPIDPMTGNNSSWATIMEDPNTAASANEPGIFDVKSGSDKTSLDGTPYADW
jgi:general secretion pathway protein G